MALQLPAFTKKREFKWFVALVIIALLLLWLQGGQKEKATPTPTPSPQPLGYELKMPDGTAITRSYEFLEGVYRDTATLTNGGNATADLTSFYVVPKAFGNDASKAGFSQNNSFNSRFLSQSPIIYASDAQLAPGGKATVGFSYGQPDDPTAPPFYFAASTPFDGEKLRPWLEQLSDYKLGSRMHALLSRSLTEIFSSGDGPETKFVNAILLSNVFRELHYLGADAQYAERQVEAILSTKESLTERLYNAFAYHALLKRSIAYADSTGQRYSIVLGEIDSLVAADDLEAANDKLLEMEKQKGVKPGAALLENSTAGNNSFDPYAFFPTHPPVISLAVSEMHPQGTNFTILNSSVDVGTPLARFEGEAAQYAGFGVVSLGKDLNISISADIGSAVLNDDGVVGFDQVNASLITRFFSLPEKYGNVTIEVNVKHESLKPLLDKHGIESGDSEFTVNGALSAIAAAEQCNPLGTSAYAPAATMSQNAATGAMACPVVGRISSRFGPRNIKDCAKCSKFHKGLDIAVPSGTPVYAPLDGVVVRAFSDGLCGLGVKISHGKDAREREFSTGYCHLSALKAKVGASVLRGQLIALSGGIKGAPGSGSSQGPHLHWITYFDEEKDDPEPYYNSCNREFQPPDPQVTCSGEDCDDLHGEDPQNAALAGVETLDDGSSCIGNRFYGNAEGSSYEGGPWHQNIVTTRFGATSDAGTMASGINSLDSRHPAYAALPHRAAVPNSCRRNVANSKGASIEGCYLIEVQNPVNGKTVLAPVLDVGPWNIRDTYPWTQARPQAETGTDLKGRPTNKAGLDLSFAAMQALGISGGKAITSWRFVDPTSQNQPAFKAPPTQSIPGSLNGLTVAIDAGHGEGRSGASGFVKEDDVVLAIALKTQQVLEASGARVVQSRSGTQSPPTLSSRAALKQNADMLISIHANAGRGKGTATYYGDLREKPTLQQNMKLARTIQSRLVSALGTDDDGIRRFGTSDRFRSYYPWGGADKPTVLIEVGYVDTAYDAKIIGSQEGQQAAANAIAQGIADYLSSA